MSLCEFLLGWDCKVENSTLSDIPAVANGSHSMVERLILEFENCQHLDQTL